MSKASGKRLVDKYFTIQRESARQYLTVGERRVYLAVPRQKQLTSPNGSTVMLTGMRAYSTDELRKKVAAWLIARGVT